MREVLRFVTDNWELISAVIIFVLMWVRKTRWGIDHAEALRIVMSVVEEMNSKDIKEAVSTRGGQKTRAAKVLRRMTEAVDPKKTTPADPVDVRIVKAMTKE